MQNEYGLFFDQLKRYPPLSRDELLETMRLVHSGNKAARQRMLMHNLRLVIHVAKRFSTHELPQEDLIQEGVLGLNHAIDKFDPERGVAFSTYAIPWIQDQLSRAIDKQVDAIRLPIHIAKAYRKCRKVEQQLETFGRTVSTQALAVHLDISFQQAEQLRPARLRQTDMEATEEHKSLWESLPADDSYDPQQQVIQEEQHAQVQHCLSQLPLRQQEVLTHWFGLNGCPLTINDIAKAKGRNRNTISADKNQALRYLQDHLGSPHDDACSLAP